MLPKFVENFVFKAAVSSFLIVVSDFAVPNGLSPRVNWNCSALAEDCIARVFLVPAEKEEEIFETTDKLSPADPVQ